MPDDFRHTPTSGRIVRETLRRVLPREAVLAAVLRDVRPVLVEMQHPADHELAALIARVDAALEPTR